MTKILRGFSSKQIICAFILLELICISSVSSLPLYDSLQTNSSSRVLQIIQNPIFQNSKDRPCKFFGYEIPGPLCPIINSVLARDCDDLINNDDDRNDNDNDDDSNDNDDGTVAEENDDYLDDFSDDNDDYLDDFSDDNDDYLDDFSDDNDDYDEMSLNCPNEGDPSTPVPIYQNDTRIAISSSNTLCTLILISNESDHDSESLIPVARSYEGNNWEAVNGPYKVEFFCEEIYCNISFPTLNPLQYSFSLTTFSHDFSLQDTASRFLEQTTFGSTNADIASLTNDISNEQDLQINFLQWIDSQMYSTPPTSHREHYRKNIKTRYRSTERIGSPLHPCSPQTRWHSYTFSLKDQGTYINVSRTSDNTAYLLSTNDISRTEVDSVEVEGNMFLEIGQSYQLCDIKKAYVGSDVYVQVGDACIKLLSGNPRIIFSSTNAIVPPNTIILPESAMNNFEVGVEVEEFIMTKNLDAPICSLLHIGVYPVYLNFDNERWLSFDPRVNLLDNSLDTVIPDGGRSQEVLGADCSNVPRTFLNEHSCILAPAATSCGARYDLPSTKIPLTADTIPKLQVLSNRFVYIISGLQPYTSPCERDMRSRWELVDTSECSQNTVSYDNDTKNTLKMYLKINEGAHFRDFIIRSDRNRHCDVATTTPSTGRVITVSFQSECWKLIHPDQYSVFDMTPWVSEHPGGSEAITQFAINNDAFLEFPTSHDVSRWESHKHLFTLLGRSGDSIKFQDLPPHLKLESVLEEFDTHNDTDSNGDHDSNLRNVAGVLVCGSPGEIKNDHSLGYTEYYLRFRFEENDLPDSLLNLQKQEVWSTIVTKSPDQLRQRMAWALSQLFAISSVGVNPQHQTEYELAYYDIFVRHAFGNYRDILKEVAYSPVMGIMLTFRGSKSTAYNLKLLRSLRFPDENFAREIMQLFSIGTVMLNMDGTRILDPISGIPIPSYTNDHIMSFARAWTGFEFQSNRGNIEIYSTSNNRIDPMQIIPDWRDVFPKINLSGGYIGDTYPLCVDIPDNFFLQKGAKYRLLGSSTVLELQSNPSSTVNASTTSLTLSSRSQLYAKLCDPVMARGSKCRLQNEVVLDENIVCDGLECKVDTLRLVQVTDTVYFEYVEPPCVKFAFYKNAKKISTSMNTEAMCANPREIAAGEACCTTSNTTSQARNCEYSGERMTFDLASNRCEHIGQSLCEFTVMEACSSDCCLSNEYYFWHDTSCNLQVKVDESGHAAIVHNPQNTDEELVHVDYQSNSSYFFPVYWDEGFPSVSNECGTGICEMIDGSCLCNIEVIDSSVFDSMPKNIDEILFRLHVGSFSPKTLESSTSRFPVLNRLKESITAHFCKQSASYDENTIFEVKRDGEDIKYLKNVQSVVKIVDMNGETTDFSFRNPPHFMNMIEPEIRDAQYETDAVLNDYFYHPNTAPFLAKYFIQRFGHSNPSPRYIQVVATAFVNGSYGESFGSGQYGDLGAMVAAVLLDREARSAVASMDPTSGSLREPILKLIGYMRSMELVTFDKYPKIELQDIGLKIGQMAHEIDSVFSFFEQDFATAGPVKDASLVAPEGRRYDSRTIIGLLNGLYSMTEFGLTSCKQGFGIKNGSNEFCVQGDVSTARARLTYSPTEPNNAKKVVDELATVLTAGRLNSESRLVIQNEYENALNNDSGLRLAQQLIASTPEFHSTSNIEFSNEERKNAQERVMLKKPSFKSLVYLYLNGGVDSFNMLVPHSGCKNKDMFAEYSSVRGEIALPKEALLTIEVKDDSQECNTFGIHPSLSVLQNLYTDGDAVFFANTGVLFEPVTKSDWEVKTKTQLFAHNIQKKEAQFVDAHQMVRGTGVLGRIGDRLTKLGYDTGSFSLTDDVKALIGQNKRPFVLGPRGVLPYRSPSSDSFFPSMYNMKEENNLRSGIFGKTWLDIFLKAKEETEHSYFALAEVETLNAFPASDIGNQLKTASETIQGRHALNNERQIFMANMNGFDTHTDVSINIKNKFDELNEALSSFVNEMKSLGVWDDVILLISSDFGRGMPPNSSGGTNHGWGGNYFAIGGGLKGGRILGKYPSDLSENGSDVLSQGRVIPTTSWDSIMNGIAMWIGLSDEQDLDYAVPGRKRFLNDLFDNNDLFGNLQKSNDAYMKKKNTKTYNSYDLFHGGANGKRMLRNR